MTNCPRCGKLTDIDCHECPGSFVEEPIEMPSDKERIEALENQVKLLWEALLSTPSLHGSIRDGLMIAGLKCNELKPMRFKNETQRNQGENNNPKQ